MCMSANATKLGLMPTLMTMLNTSRRPLYKADAMKASFQKEVGPDGSIKQLDTRPSRKGSIAHDALAVVHGWLHTPEASREDNGDKAPMRTSVLTAARVRGSSEAGVRAALAPQHSRYQKRAMGTV